VDVLPSITTTNLNLGGSYTFSITTNASAIVSVWFDWNRNGVFEPSEWYQPYTTGTGGSALVTVPVNASSGLTKMRVRSRLTTNPNGATDACLAMGSGETEDYIVSIVAPTGMKENSKSYFTVSPNPAQTNVSISLKNAGVVSTVSVTDVLGNQVMRKIETNNAKVDLNVSSLTDGVYLITISNEFSSTVKKLVVAK
jgi:ABC-type arginine/histidine transport system permease subunit